MSQPARVAVLVVTWLGLVVAASCGDGDGASEPAVAPVAAQDAEARATATEGDPPAAAPAPAPRAEPSAATRTAEPARGTALAARAERVDPLGGSVFGDGSDNPPGTMAYEGLLNRDFGMLTDATTSPAKFGGYWRGAFAPEEGVADDRVTVLTPTPGLAGEPSRSLQIEPGQPPVVQKIVADERWTDRLSVRIDWTPVGSLNPYAVPAPGELHVTLRDGPGRTLQVTAPASGTPLELGALFREQHGVPPTPRLELELHAEVGTVLVAHVSARVILPAPTLDELTARLADHVRGALETWCLPRDEGGLGLVDPDDGRVLVESYDVVTGELGAPRRQVGFHTIHNLLIRWIGIARHAGWDAEVARWTPLLERSMRRVLTRHFGPDNHLPFNRDARTGERIDDQAITVASWIELLLDAREVLDDETLREDLLAQARRTADTLVRLAEVHDLDPVKFPNEVRLNHATGVLEGAQPNWFGHMPVKITPRGAIDTPRRYNTAWAIVSGRSFWYHLLRSPAAVLRVHALRPAKGDLHAVTRALEQYDRPWDAARYDLENDTDDHYGYLMDDGMHILDVVRTLPESVAVAELRARAESLVRGATNHRLEPSAASAGDTLWIQAIRLGTACAGDSPRAFKGVRKLIDYAPDHARVPLYREALLELAANDFKGRQLTNGQFTESFFKHWEMVCICFFGTYQGDCRERPLSAWQGDVGDVFGGPPKNAFGAQLTAWRVATPAQRPAILARFATILDVSERDLLREHGFVFGLEREIAEQYELPEKYTHGLQTRSSAGLGTVATLAEALEAFLGVN